MHFRISAEVLDRLHGPAGLYIASKTPAEIALSIMAEVVAVKNGVRNLQAMPIAAYKSTQAQAPKGSILNSTCLV